MTGAHKWDKTLLLLVFAILITPLLYFGLRWNAFQRHINDEQGRKMSKRLGNVVDPMRVIDETGADALRWYFYISNPELTSRFSARLVKESAQKFLLPLWNALSFFSIYANLDGWTPEGAPAKSAGSRAEATWV